MKKHNFFECETVEQIEVEISTMNYDDLIDLLKQYHCTLNDLVYHLAKSKGMKDSYLAAAKKNEEKDCQEAWIVHHAPALYLAKKYLEEKIRSDKVIEGVLKDISNSAGWIADNFEDKGEKIMDEEKAKEFKEMIWEELSKINEQLAQMNERFLDLQEQVKAAVLDEEKSEPDPEAEKAEAAQAANDEVPVVEAEPIHLGTGNSARIVLCGALGTVSQPYNARIHEPITNDRDVVTCPECLKMLAEEQKS